VLPGDQITENDDEGERIVSHSFALLLNASHESVPFRLGTRRRDLRWKCILDTSAWNSEPASFEHMSIFPLQPHSFVVLQAELFEEPEPE
jgi:hypothetical protein